jgi:uncharacterized protein YeeX (DUF496 family)
MSFKLDNILLRTRETQNKKIISLKKRVDALKSLYTEDLEFEIVIEDINNIINCFKNL